jgi:hypothetical protein
MFVQSGEGMRSLIYPSSAFRSKGILTVKKGESREWVHGVAGKRGGLEGAGPMLICTN